MAGRTTSSRREARAHLSHRAGLLKDVAAFIAALLTALAVARGLLLIAPAVQLVVLLGLVAGPLATSEKRAAIVAALAGLVAPLLITPYQFDGLPAVAIAGQVMLMVVGAALTALMLKRVLRRRPQLEILVALAAVLLLFANLVAFSILVTSPDGTPVATHLSDVPPPNTQLTDNAFYQRVLGLMGKGTGYYEAFRQAYHENTRWGTDPGSILGYRLPTFFWLWTQMPWKPWSIFATWLLLAAAGMLSVLRLAAVRESPVWAVPGAATLGSYVLYLGTTNAIFATESWAGLLGLIAFTAAVVSYHSSRWQTWTWFAASVALFSALVREIMIFVLVGGLISSFFARREERTRRILAWGCGLLLFTAGYAAHAMHVSTAISGAGEAAYMSGGFAFLVRAFSWADAYLGGPWLLVVFAGLAGVAVLRAPSRSERALFALSTAAPLAAFLVVGNSATTDAGAPVNYWAPVVIPILVALGAWSLPVSLISCDGCGETVRRERAADKSRATKTIS